jgi:hypothetical protein
MGPLEAAVGVADVIRYEVTLFDPAFAATERHGEASSDPYAPHLLDHLMLGVKKPRNRLQTSGGQCRS